MKTLLFFSGLFFSSILWALEPGTYFPHNGNNDSICPQEVRVVKREGRLHALKVVYVGDCYYWGPFEYPCEGDVCGDSTIVFELTSERSYHWYNSTYDIGAEFTPESGLQ